MLVETLPWVVGGGLAVGASLRWNWWRWPQPGIPVLMYHHLGACPLGSSAERKLWVSPRQFQRQLSALQRWDYQITSLSEFSDYLAPQRFEEGQKPRTHPETLLGLQPRKGGLWRRQARSAYRSVVKYAVARLPGLGAPPEASLTEHGFGMSSSERSHAPPPSVLLTFDDGYASVYEMAFPLLKEFGARAAVFLVAQGVDRDNFWRDAHAEPSVRMLTGSQIREMQQEGIAFGCHGMTHRNLLRCNDAELRYEVADSKRRLEDRLGRSVDTFAYPFGAGAFDPRIRGAVVQAGYRLAFAIRQGKAHPSQDPFALHRVLIRGDDTRLDFALNVHRGKARL